MWQIQAVSALLAAWAFVSPFLAAQPAAVRDAAGMLKPETVSEAETVAAEIKKASGKDISVETFPSIPASLQSKFNSMNKDQFYRDWSLGRARELRLNGIYVMIVQNPGRLEIAIGKETRQSVFTDSDRDRMRDTMLQDLRRKDYDGAVLAGMRFAQGRIAEHVKARAAAPAAAPQSRSPAVNSPVSPQPTAPGVGRSNSAAPVAQKRSPVAPWICLGVGVIVVLVLMSAFRRARSVGAGMPPGGGYGYGGGPGVGGGGFGSGLFGGLLGGLLGNWMADRWRGSGGLSGSNSGTDAGAGANFFDHSGPSATGGDFGDATSSGGDFGGGGDSGGGDFGGGDSGGSSSGGDF